MALNPAYEAIGRGFVQQYYAMFDDPNTRPQLVNMYNVSTKLSAQVRLGNRCNLICPQFCLVFRLYKNLLVRALWEG